MTTYKRIDNNVYIEIKPKVVTEFKLVGILKPRLPTQSNNSGYQLYQENWVKIDAEYKIKCLTTKN